MNHTRKDILRIIRRYRAGKATPEEIKFLDSYDAQFDKEGIKMDDRLETDIDAFLQHHIRQSKPVRLWPRIAAAASVIIVLSAGGYFLLKPKRSLPGNQTAQHDVAPGGNKAYITLANGKKIDVTDAKTGLLAKQGNVNIIKAASGKVEYLTANDEADLTKVFNTVSTPVTGQHSIVLPDGTYVMLDAESSITFPVQFASNKREVKLSGHAWFVVKYNKQQPFSVLTGKTRVNDLGTQFDLNAYPDEPAVTTTLVEGSVAVNNKKIIPGEQALVNNDHVSVQSADTSAVIAWKDGNFIFRNQDIKVTMRQLARWYGLTIVYKDAPERLDIVANISRSRPLSVVLAAMEQTGAIHFKLNGRELTVTQ